MKHLAWLACVLLAGTAWAIEPDRVYVKRASWAASMAATRERLLTVSGTQVQHDALIEQLCRRFWEDFPETDWLLQDRASGQTPDAFDAQHQFGWYFQPELDTASLRRLIGRVLDEVGSDGRRLEARLDRLAESGVPAEDPAWLELYVVACQARRIERLRPLLALAPRFVFTKHYTLGGSHYAYTEGQSDAQAERHFIPNSALCVAEWDGQTLRIETLLEDPHGVVRDPDVSFDGQRVIFAWKRSDRLDDYHLYEMEVGTRSIRPITSGLGVADYEPAYLPDGGILFNSTRCVQTVDCWWTEVSNLYRCDAHGQAVRRLCFDQVHDNFPTVSDDGRVLYTRWEYNDRGQIYPQPLLQMNPDGTGQREFYGVNSWFPTTILHARAIPGTSKVLAIATGHHTRQTGKLILIDPAKGRQENAGVQLVAPVRDTPAVRIDAYGQDGELFQYPYPLSATHFLVAYHPAGWKWAGPLGPRFAVYFMTLDGRRELLAFDSIRPCNQPVALRPRRAWVRPSPVDQRKTEATCVVQDVYAGAGLRGVARGTIQTLRVVALEFRAAGIGANRNGGPGGAALISTPIAIGNGAWDVKVILGDTRVEPDGSAFFRVPARRPVYFQLLDRQGRMVQTMRSWTTLQPGENASCVGCHEHQNTAPRAGQPASMALRRDARSLVPFHGPARGFSFPKEIQPILDAKCVRCHDGEPGKSFGLTSREILDPAAKRRWSEASLALTHARLDDPKSGGAWRGDADHPLVNWVSAQSAPPLLPPYAAGSNRSQLMEILDQGHEGVRLSREELDKIAAWIDLGVPFCGDYLEANAWTPAEEETYRRFLAKRQQYNPAPEQTAQ